MNTPLFLRNILKVMCVWSVCRFPVADLLHSIITATLPFIHFLELHIQVRDVAD